jgi:DNA repair protein RecN (Recombination protein N)
MLKSLRVQNYALIQQLEIEFEKDFSTLTGETGAGKSILLGALSLVLGSRADSSSISIQSDKCIVEAIFDIHSYNLESFFNENDLDFENETLIRREILNTGKSRAFVNDTPVNLPVLKDLATKLIDIHSQHENLELNSNAFQLKVLDSAAKTKEILAVYKNLYKEYKGELQQIEKLKEEAQKAETDYDYNLFQLNQLNEIKLEDIDLEGLESELTILNNAEEIQQNLGVCFSYLSEGEINLLDQLKASKQSLERIKSYYPMAENFIQRIDSAFIDLKDISSEIEQSISSLEYNPERAIELKEMVDSIYTLLHKHKAETINELLERKKSFQEKVNTRELYTLEIEHLEKKHTQTTFELTTIASQLTDKRNQATQVFTERIVAQLSGLGMPHAAFKVEVSTEEAFNDSGCDRVSFLFSANKNQLVQNISKIASGGEISRLMLSIKAILSENTALPTIIFDEIDSGVSGEIADKMADIMKQMAANMQVISITHLPQIAARGMNHYKVFKIESNHTVSTHIQLLNPDERVVEIARMLSGKDISKEAIENAKTLILS